MEKKLLKNFMKKNCKRQVKQGLELNNQLREKVYNSMLNEKVMIICLLAG